MHVSYSSPNIRSASGIREECPESSCCDLRASGKCELEWNFNSWTKQYSYFCENTGLSNIAKAVVLGLSTIICFVLLYLADIFGRKKIIFASSFSIVLGVSGACFIPEVMTKMVSVGVAAGAEGAFSALFTILTNETTLDSTMLRSILIGGSFLAYGLGCIALNIVTLWVNEANHLLYIASAMLVLTVSPSFFSYYETPGFLHQKGEATLLIRTLKGISNFNKKHEIDINHFEKLIVKGEEEIMVLQSARIKVSKIKKENHSEYMEAVSSLFGNRKYMIYFIAMSLQATLLYMLFYGMIVSVQNLGLSSMNLNGIALGVSQTIGFIVILPFTHILPRRITSISMQGVLMISAGLLFCISFFTRTEMIRTIETIISTVAIGSTMSAFFPVLYLHTSELFPVEMRGLANAMILFIGKLFGGSAPFVCQLCENYEIHVLVGCSIAVLLSLPITFLLPETHGSNHSAQTKIEDEEEEDNYLVF